MSWTFNNIRIYANRLDTKKGQTIARLQPLSGSTILHLFGTESRTVSFGGLVVTSGDILSLEALVGTSTSYTLSGPEGVLGDYFIKELSYKRTPTVNISVYDRPGLPCESPVYDASLELFLDG